LNEAFFLGTELLLGLGAMHHDQTVRKMRIDSKVAAIEVSDKRDMSHRFIKTRVGGWVALCPLHLAALWPCVPRSADRTPR